MFLVPDNKSYTVAIIKPDVVAHGKADEIIMKVRAQFKGQMSPKIKVVIIFNVYAGNIYNMNE